MIKLNDFKQLEQVKTDKQMFKHVFKIIFLTKAQKYLSFIELSEIEQMFFLGEENKLRITLDSMTEKAKKKSLEAIASGSNDQIYEKRYREIKELDDLYTYYIDQT